MGVRASAAAMVVSAVLVAGCGGGSRIASTTPTTTAPGRVAANATVDRVIDGDTIDVIVDGAGERVRLTGIDTPEMARRDTGAPAECFGDEATAFTESLLPAGTAVRLERDVVGRDDYGRLLV